MNLQVRIRRILKEETQIPSQVLRRHHLIDEMFKDMRIRYKRLFCEYRNPNILLEVLYERTLSDLYHAWFSETVSDDDWDVASEYIEKYLIDKYEKETIDIWNKRCKSKTLKEYWTPKEEDYSDIETVWPGRTLCPDHHGPQGAYCIVLHLFWESGCFVRPSKSAHCVELFPNRLGRGSFEGDDERRQWLPFPGGGVLLATGGE